ncbi:DUF6612 family protein [Streptococcus massiliensis]|uniref:Lipoprotein n=1 Tax=Streptococcus massiliensis TaxID=313439 RepID=A0A380KY54_9STRE|nr:DUF6612 family protein [Streptococcus massiliensis]SUN76074.1 Uncharacterised protein [Streptococcus massiliensis]
MKCKRLWSILLVSLLSLFVVGCSASSQIDKKEVINQIVKQSDSIKSLDAKMKMKIKAELPKEASASTSEMTIGMDIDMSLIQEPLTTKMQIDMDMLGNKTKLEAYLKDNSLYAKMPNTNTWVKQDASAQLSQITDQSNAVYNKEYFKALEKSIDSIKIEEKDGNYVINIPDASKALQEVFKKQLGAINSANSAASNATFSNTHITYVINKKTKNPVSVTMESDIEASGSKAHMTMEVTYSNINKVKEIKLPAEAESAAIAD